MTAISLLRLEPCTCLKARHVPLALPHRPAGRREGAARATSPFHNVVARSSVARAAHPPPAGGRDRTPAGNHYHGMARGTAAASTGPRGALASPGTGRADPGRARGPTRPQIMGL